MDLLRKIKIIINCKLDFKILKKKNTLIYDIYSAEELKDYFDRITTEFLDTRYAKINVNIFIKSFLEKLFFKKLTLSQIYILNYIKSVEPSYVITYQDQSFFFFTLKKYFPEVKFIIVQASMIFPGYLWSLYHLNKMNIKEKYKIDFFFVFGESFKRIFSKYFDSEFIIIGSFRNNLVSFQKNKSKDLVFISGFKSILRKKIILLRNGGSITGENYYYKSDQNILKFLLIYCKKKKINLKILLRSTNRNQLELSKEKIFFSESLGKNQDIQFIHKKNRYSVYKLINRFNYFVTQDSTLGYEILSKRKRVGFINIREKFAKILSFGKHSFGWPNSYPENKFFWTSSSNYKKMAKCLDFIYTCEDKVWKKTVRQYGNPIIIFNSYNKIFRKKMQKIGVKLVSMKKNNL
jgi:surface carbohydrate biosynthesis protein